MNVSEYKKYHESFMQNNHGSSAWHTFLSIHFTVVCALICPLIIPKSSKYQPIYEYIVIILPLVFGHTLLANYTNLLNIFLLIIYSTLLWKNKHKINLSQFSTPSSGDRIASVTYMRGLTYLITVYSILAVDFKIFPRNLAKTERFGYSLMDTGVGLFVLMSGLVHKDEKDTNLTKVMKNNYKLVLILLTLGFSRFYLVTTIDYQTHITEYGVHWNFFYTLAITKVISVLLLNFVNYKLSFTCISIGVIHEILLSLHLQQWVFGDHPRDNFISANREGLASCLGYVHLYLFAVYIKKLINQKCVPRYRIIFNLIYMCSFLWTLALAVNYFKPTSRTLANLGYCTFLEAVFVSVFIFLYITEVMVVAKHNSYTFKVPLTIHAVNDNGLLFFLLGNVTTGLINLTFRTFFVNDYFAILILNFYMIVTILFAIYLQRKGIKI